MKNELGKKRFKRHKDGFASFANVCIPCGVSYSNWRWQRESGTRVPLNVNMYSEAAATVVSEPCELLFGHN